MILITSPPGSFYLQMIRSLANGFRAAGLNCLYSNKNLNDEAFDQFIGNSSTQAVLQINKPLLDRPNWRKRVQHLLWLQDYRFNGKLICDDLGGSDWYYFLIHPKAFNIKNLEHNNWSVLSPGCGFLGGKQRNFFAYDSLKYGCDMSLAGFIPEPIEYSAPFVENANGTILSIADILDRLPKHILCQSHFDLDEIHAAVRDICEKMGSVAMTDEKMQNFDEILPRTLERELLADMAISVSNSFKIYGPKSWKSWDKFRRYYKRYISDPNEMRKVFKHSKVNLHNSGLGMHFRVLDCFAAGGVMAVNRTPLDNLKGGILEHFEPGVHFEHYNFDDFTEVAKSLLANKEKRVKMSNNAYAEAINRHSWYHRALQIIEDNNLETQKSLQELDTRTLEEWGKIEEKA